MTDRVPHKTSHFPASQSAAAATAAERAPEPPGPTDSQAVSYTVGFYNETSDSTGHEHHVCQQEIEVTTQVGQEQAIADAIAEFEDREDISRWTSRAGTIECSLTDSGSAPLTTRNSDDTPNWPGMDRTSRDRDPSAGEDSMNGTLPRPNSHSEA